MAEYGDDDTDHEAEPHDTVDTEGPMSDGELQSVASAVITDCVQFCDGELSPLRALATRYYQGKPFGNEEDGRSQVVLTEVRDIIAAIIPQMVEIFFGTERPVEYVPRSKDQVAMAEQATDYANWVFCESNAGFLEGHSVIKDGLLKKVGAFKTLWDESTEVKTFWFENVTDSGLEALQEDPDYTIKRIRETGTVQRGTAGPARRGIPTPDAYDPTASTTPDPAEQPPLGMPSNSPAGAGAQGSPTASIGTAGINRQPPAPLGSLGAPKAPADGAESDAPTDTGTEPVHSVEGVLNRTTGRLRIFSLPPEEFIFSREARTIDDAVCVAHRTHKTRGELRAMGYSEADLDAHSGDDTTLRNNEEEIARRNVIAIGDAGQTQDVESGEYNDKVLYVEAYIHVDYDGDGIAELRKICTLGNAYYVALNEPANRRPFAHWSPDPEPHTMVGQSIADRTMDVQKTKSMIMRSTLDSLSLALFPRMAIQEGQVNITDILNTDIGAPIRTRGAPPASLQVITQPFVGKEALPVLQYYDDITKRRTGLDDGAMGLDSDALQSTDPDAVKAALTASQQQVQLFSRIFAESCMKPLFKLILKELVERQPRKTLMRLRGQWVEVDPRSWDADMDVTVNVGLGKGRTQEKISTLLQIAGEQKDILATYGPANPMVSVAMYRNTLAEIAALRNCKNDLAYFKVVAPDWQPPAPPPPPQSPEMVQAQAQIAIEKMKTVRDLAIKEQELRLKTQDQAAAQDLAIKKAAMDYTLRRYQIDAQFKAQYTAQQSEQDATETQHWMDAQDQLHQQSLDTAAQGHQQALAAQQQAHDQALAQNQQQFEQDNAPGPNAQPVGAGAES